MGYPNSGIGNMSTDTENGGVWVNGRIYQAAVDGGDAPTFVDSMVVKDGVIEHVGSATDDAVTRAKEAGARVTDLQGKAVLPGFIDGHLHLLLLGQSLKKVALDGCGAQTCGCDS